MIARHVKQPQSFLFFLLSFSDVLIIFLCVRVAEEFRPLLGIFVDLYGSAWAIISVNVIFDYTRSTLTLVRIFDTLWKNTCRKVLLRSRGSLLVWLLKVIFSASLL